MKTSTNIPKIKNMISPNGNEVPNQFIIHADNRTVFQSYSTVIAVTENGKTILDREKWNYSNTTSKYRNQFLGETTKETQKKIAAGIYELADLN